MGGKQSPKAQAPDSCGRNACSKPVKKGIQCDVCEIWYHQKCSGLIARAYKLYADNECLKWVCNECIRACEQRLAKKTHTKDETLEQGDETGVDLGDITVVDRWADQPVVKPVIPRGWDSLLERMTQHESEFVALKSKTLTIEKQLSQLYKESDLALGRHRNVIVKGIPEPTCSAPKQRALDIRRHLELILRQAGIPGTTTLRRVFRLGRWREPVEGRSRPPRPVLVEFSNPRIRDELLTAATKISEQSKGRLRVEPDLPKGRPLNGDRRPPQGPVTKGLTKAECSPRVRLPRASPRADLAQTPGGTGGTDGTDGQLFSPPKGATSSPRKAQPARIPSKNGKSTRN